MSIIARRLMIHGRVQGVFYRKWAARTATDLGLTGWVRNLAEGSVEAVIEGQTDSVERFVALARQGPVAASVSRIDVEEAEPSGLPTFEQRNTL